MRIKRRLNRHLTSIASRIVRRYGFVLVLKFITIVSLVGQSFAQVREVEISAHTGDLKRYSWDDLGYSSSYRATAADPKTFDRQSSFKMRIGPPDLESRFELQYQRASEGDVVPMFGTTCRVGTIYRNSKLLDVGVPDFGPADGRLIMTAINPPDPQINVPPNCLTIPNGGSVARYDKTWQTPFYRVEVESISIRDGTPVARFKVFVANFRGVKRQLEPGGKSSVDLKTLDRLEVPASFRVFIEGKEVFRDLERFRVKHIVLPDPQKHIMGWVSLEPMHEHWNKPPATKDVTPPTK